MASTQPDDQTPQESPFLDLVLVVVENLKLIVLGSLAVGIVALGISFLIAPRYVAMTRILPPAQQQSASAVLAGQLGALAGLVGSPGALKSPADQYVALLKSRTVADQIVEQFNLRQLYDVRYTEDARRELSERSKITAGAKDGLISIEVEDTDPKRAADIANAMVDALRGMTNTLAVTEASQRRLFFEAQLKQAKDNLAKAEVALRSSGVSEASLRTMPQSALEAVARLRAQITAQDIKLSSMKTFMTDSNPEYRVALGELAALRTELAKVEQSNTTKAGGEGTEYITRFRDFKYHETLFELMAKQFELARLDEAREGAIVQVVDAAKPPEKKSKPKRGQIAVLTLICALLLFTLFVLARHALRRTLANPHVAAKSRQSTDGLSRFWSIRKRRL
jgi:tyrosine-protein kinase Etk/Wzc